MVMENKQQAGGTGKPAILIVDDEEGLRHGLKRFFTRQGFAVLEAPDYRTAVDLAGNRAVDVALIDIRLKNGKSGIDLLRELRAAEPDLIPIVITGYGSVDTAVTSMKEGAADYILKPIDNKKLLNAVSTNLQLRALRHENTYLRGELNSRCSTRFVTRDPAIRRVFAKADAVKNSPVTVLVSGESGTGKEVLARYIHFTSERGDRSFVTINCAALSDTLLLSELFGHERGAFTGACERQIGKFEIADRGTLFLDEICEMSLDAQAKLLRVIEHNSFERVGGTKRIQVDVRVIAATNTDLERLIERGGFREDLYYRINVVNLHLPPLRERRKDIPLLVDHFVRLYSRRYNRRVERFSDRALELLSAHRWPGNVRELENLVNQAVLLSTGPVVEAGDLGRIHAPASGGRRVDLDYDQVRSLRETVAGIAGRYERDIIEHFLRKNRYNKSQTARDLSLTRKTLAGKMARYGL